jgi:hypothetical protein
MKHIAAFSSFGTDIFSLDQFTTQSLQNIGRFIDFGVQFHNTTQINCFPV